MNCHTCKFVNRENKSVCFVCSEYSAYEPSTTPEYTGGSVSYYAVRIAHPTSGGQPYSTECNDIVEALRMNYAEGNVFKAVWRMCAARQGKSKVGYADGLYDAEKVVFFGQRLIEMARGND